MALTLKNCVVLVDDLDLSATSNSAELEVTVSDLDVTTFRSGGAVERIAGLDDWTLEAEGWWDSVPDAVLSATLGQHAVYTIAPDNIDGGPAYIGKALATSYAIGGEVGEAGTYKLSAAGSIPPAMLRGTTALPLGTYTVDTTGSNFELGALGADESLTVVVHVLGAPGGTLPTLTVTVESDETAGFSTPTTRLTMSGLTAGASVGTVSGAVTDSHWRIKADLGGTTPSFPLFITLARSK